MSRFKLILSITLVSFILLGLGGYQWERFTKTALVTQSFEFELQPGSSVKQIAHELHSQGILKHPFLFELFVRFHGDTKRLQAGEYRIDAGTTVNELLNKLVSGDVILHQLTIVDGWTFRRLMNVINANPFLNHTLINSSPSTIADKLKLPGKSPEGWFYPDTYSFAKNTKDIDILKHTYKKMQSYLNEAWKNKASNLPYKTSYEALIVASMIEKETAIENEKPIIAGIIVRRLKKRMLLQIDPTVIYGLGKRFKGKLTTQDIQENTPYNTYLHKGLPPTPICIPDRTSIDAALHPDNGTALYFVAKGDGSHVFSATLKAHDRAIIKYQLSRKTHESK